MLHGRKQSERHTDGPALSSDNANFFFTEYGYGELPFLIIREFVVGCTNFI